MDKKNLAKAAILAMALTVGAVSAEAASNVAGFESSTLLAVAGCGGGSRPTPPPQGDGYYGHTNGSYSTYEDNTADDSNNPYATPNRNMGGGTRDPRFDKSGSGNNAWNNNRAMTGGGAQSNPYGTDQRYQTGAPHGASTSTGGGNYGTMRNNNPSMNSANDPYGYDNR